MTIWRNLKRQPIVLNSVNFTSSLYTAEIRNHFLRHPKLEVFNFQIEKQQMSCLHKIWFTDTAVNHACSSFQVPVGLSKYILLGLRGVGGEWVRHIFV